MPLYSVRKLCKTYKQGQVVANDNLSFDLEEGEIFGLLGPNGAGKTTLVRMMMGLMAPTSGDISLLGHDVVANPHKPSELVSYVTQRPDALADLTVMEALSITGHLRGMTRPAARRQAFELVEEFQLTEFAGRVLGRLSGGQKRLTGFCLALMGNRPVMILDEPTNDLDPVHRRWLWNKIQQLNRERGTTIILVTHNVAEAEKVLRRVGIINRGKITAIDRVGALKARVSDSVRLELCFRDGGRDCQAQRQLLEGIFSGAVMQLDPGRWQVLAPRERAEREIVSVLQQVGLEQLEDMRILLPTLEDVYMKLGGSEQLAHAN